VNAKFVSTCPAGKMAETLRYTFSKKQTGNDKMCANNSDKGFLLQHPSLISQIGLSCTWFESVEIKTKYACQACSPYMK
jgi:hypothetical protein